MSVTEGACGTESQQKAEVFRRFSGNPSGAPHQLPLHKGAFVGAYFSLCATEKAKGKFKTSKPKVHAFKTRDSRRSFFFAPQSDTGRLPSF
ncbi:MAG TPA: hypothetical protein DCE08_00175 [Ruminococcaceae bacterium]|nr:hypothetical protein [Oscillospiraceae bacterium]